MNFNLFISGQFVTEKVLQNCIIRYEDKSVMRWLEMNCFGKRFYRDVLFFNAVSVIFE